MGMEAIPSLLAKFSLPAILGMLINAVYNVVDTFFIGKLGTAAIGAVAVAFPVYNLIVAVGLVFGAGAASSLSRLLGAQNYDEANRMGSTALYSSLICAVLFSAASLIFLEPILGLCGATDTIMPYAIDYSRIILMGSTAAILNITLHNMLRSEGAVLFSVIILVSGAVLNIILDPILIFTLGMGIKGAAVATVLSQCLVLATLFIFHLRGKSELVLNPFNFSPHKDRYIEILKVGIPVFLFQLLAAVSLGATNQAAAGFGDAAVAAMGITSRIFAIGMFVVFGFSQGFQPIAGFNFGAGLFGRLNTCIRMSLVWSTLFVFGFAACTFLLATPIAGLFTNDPTTIAHTSKAMWFYSILFPFYGFQIITTTLFLALGKGKEGGILSMVGQGLFYIPLVIILPYFLALDGVFISRPIADALVISLTFLFSLRLKKELDDITSHPEPVDANNPLFSR